VVNLVEIYKMADARIEEIESMRFDIKAKIA